LAHAKTGTIYLGCDERLTPLGIMGATLRASLKPLNLNAVTCGGFQEGPPDHYSFSSLSTNGYISVLFLYKNYLN